MQLRKLFSNAVLRCRQSRASLTWVWIAAWVILVLIAAVVFSSMFWCWLSAGESGSTTIRNLVLVVAATIGLPLAIWRSKVAERQATTAQCQAETAQRSLLNERYQKGAEMMGSKVLSVRLGGIYALARLAREHPGDYHPQIMSLLCAFVRHPTAEAGEAPELINDASSTEIAEFNRGWNEEGNDRPTRVREDVQAVMTAVRERSGTQIAIEKEGAYSLNLFRADLSDADLYDADLEGASLRKAKLSRAKLLGANLEGAYLTEAELDDANLQVAKLKRANLKAAKLAGADLLDAKLQYATLVGADLTGANLDGADLTGVDLRGCEGLTREQLGWAVARKGNPPDLTHVVDTNTEIPLVWEGRTVT